MVDLAFPILDKKKSKFDPHSFKCKYEAALKALVKRKAAGKTIQVSEEKKEESKVDALKQRLGRKKAATRTLARPSRKGKAA